MEPLLLGVAAPSIANTIGQAASVATKPFTAVLEAAGRVLQSGTGSSSEQIDGAARSNTEQSPPLEMADLRSRVDALQASLEQRIREAIESSGLSIDRPLRLKMSDFDETIEVVDAHPQRPLLEAALAEDPTIAEDFRRLAIIQKLLATAEARDPWSTMAETVEQLGDRYEAVLQKSLDSSGVRLEFES